MSQDCDTPEETLLALDLETTGPNPEEAHIVEFSFIELDEDLIEQRRWTQRLQPPEPIPPEATEVHGITNEEVSDYPPFDTYAEEIQALVGDAILLVYNADFDVEILHRELERAGQPGLPITHPVIDAYEIFKEQNPHTLENAVRYYLDREHEGAHTAEGDAEALVDVFRAQRLVDPDLGPTPSDAVSEPEHDWLDRDRKIYHDEQGRACFGFGKHEGEPIEEHPDYAEWMLDDGNGFGADTKRLVSELI